MPDETAVFAEKWSSRRS